MKERSRASFKNLIVSIVVSSDAYARLRAGGDKMDTYVEAVNQILMLYATNANIAMATSEISRL